MAELSPIQSFYKDKTVFITGGSGFMGKVLIEKLLYACSELKTIYLLIRPKRGRLAEGRIEDLAKLPLFQRIRKEKPDVLKKIVPLCGELTLTDLGLTTNQQEKLVNETDIVFHCAATLRLEAKLKDAIEMNTIGTKKVLDLAKRMKNLKAFVHLSTAFCHVDQIELGERVYDSTDDPQDVMRLVQWLDESAIDLLTPKLLQPHPNTYTYSKRLAETLVEKEYPNLPCSIARPSIVIPSYREPMPGWVDNLNGPVGLLVGAGKGVIRSMHCNPNYHAEVIPVDIAINALIAFSHKIGTMTEKPKSLPVVNITQSRILPITWGEVLDKGRKVLHDNPFDGQIWYPDGDIRSNKFVHDLFVFFFHILPAYFIDFLMILFRQKRFMVRIQKRISDGLEVLQYFTTREWIFHNSNILAIAEEMHPMDKELFPIDLKTIDIISYMKDIVLGARQYILKEDLSSLPKARRHQAVMYVVHITAIYLFYFGVAYMIYKSFHFARVCLDFVTELMKHLPLVGSLVQRFVN